jgi:opacity protein-like surface antigen
VIKRCIYLLLALVFLSTPVFGQRERKPEIFVGYSNLQAEGLQDRDDSGSFFGSNFFTRRGLHGANAEVTVFPFAIFGLTGDFSFNRKERSFDFTGRSNSEKTTIAYFMAGPSYFFAFRERFEPFARVMIGLAHTGYKAQTKQAVSNGQLTSGFQTGSIDFTMAFGGGLDVKFDKFKVRVIQFDYAPIFLGDHAIAVLGQAGALQPLALDGHRQDNFRFSFGVSF